MSPEAATILPLSKIKPGDNPRRYFNQQKHDELVASFRLRGMLQPMLVRPADDETFSVVAGGRRYRAALEAFGPEGEVPVVVREMTDQEALEAAIDENDNRDDTSETEQADAAARALAACNGDRAEAARRLAWSASKFDRRLALAGLSDAVKLALDERRIKVGHAELLAVVPADKQDTALRTILDAGLDVAKTRELLLRVTQSLAAAVFDKTECATCSYNSVRQAALFETHVGDGHCTNPGCFQLKTETAEAAKAPPSNSGAASDVKTPVAVPGDEHPSTPDSSPGSRSGQGSATGKAASAKAPRKPRVSAKSISERMAGHREAAWRAALSAGIPDADTLDPLVAAALVGVVKVAARDSLDFAHVARLSRGLNIDLRESWQVDGVFLGYFDKDELKLIAQECGLVAHMGEKAFAKLLGLKAPALIAGMLNAPGFDWAGRLPSAMTLDGEYGPPPDADEAPGADASSELTEAEEA